MGDERRAAVNIGETQWFRFEELPQKLTMTARNAIEADRRRCGFYSSAAGAS
jgi:hypothetical protein